MITIGPYTYPKHFTYPVGQGLYFANNIERWLKQMPDLLTKHNTTLEIGALYGGASVFILDNYCNKLGSHHHIVDINSNDYIEHNLKAYPNCSYHLGESADVLRNFPKNSIDLAYIDGSHMAKNVMEDGVNCAHIVKPGGYIVFDDYTWGTDMPERARPAIGINAFLKAYDGHFQVIELGHQVILKKKECPMTDTERASNYYNGQLHLTNTIIV